MSDVPETKSAGGLVINPNNEILLVQEFGQYWGLPRGHVEEGENTGGREGAGSIGNQISNLADTGRLIIGIVVLILSAIEICRDPRSSI